MTAPQTKKTCPSCGSNNRPDCRFCTGCGKEFPKERTCPRCNATVSPTQRFCNACGAPVDAAAGAPAGGKMKFCHQCRALIDCDAKFCNQCGAVIADMPLCPRCGDPIGPEEKFCGVCGLPFTSAPPAQQAPARPVVPPIMQPPAQPVMQPKPAGSRGFPFGKIVAGIVVVLVIFIGIILLLPDSPPPPGGGTTAGGTVPTGEEPLRVQQSEKESRQMLNAAATALEKRDIAAFSQSVYPKDLARLGSPLVFQSGGEQGLAAALRDAQVVESYKGIIYYTSDNNGSPIRFITIKEGESWFISGL